MVKGSGKQAKRAVKEAVGKLTGDSKLKAEGKTDKTARKPPERRRSFTARQTALGPFAGYHHELFMSTILIVLLVVLLLGGGGYGYNYSRGDAGR
jgi:hypothetical protein